MGKIYGNLMNRLEEGRSFAPIQVGTDITMYHWSDRDCYYVTRVVDEKHIFVKEYRVVADHEKDGGMGHQNWLYFKSNKEAQDYLRRFFPDTPESDYEAPEQEWVFRYGKWMRCYTITNQRACFTERERKAFQKDGCFKRYYNLPGDVSFGVRNYYYDWSF